MCSLILFWNSFTLPRKKNFWSRKDTSMARWVVPASWALNPTAEGDQRCPRCLLQLMWRQPPLRLGSRHLVLHLQIASAFSVSKTRHPQKAGGSPLSHHCVNSLGWLIPEHYPICRPCCLRYLLIKLRKSNCGLFELVINWTSLSKWQLWLNYKLKKNLSKCVCKTPIFVFGDQNKLNSIEKRKKDIDFR